MILIRIKGRHKPWPSSVTAVQHRDVLEEDPDVGSKHIHIVLLRVITTAGDTGHAAIEGHQAKKGKMSTSRVNTLNHSSVKPHLSRRAGFLKALHIHKR